MVLLVLVVVMGAAQRGSEESMFAVRGGSCGLVFVLDSDGLLLWYWWWSRDAFEVMSEVDSSYSVCMYDILIVVGM